MQKTFQLSTLLSHQVKKYGKRAALYYRDALSKKWLPVSWNELCQKVETLAGALIQSNVKLHFESPEYFATAFRKKTGMSPSEFRKA